MARDLNKRRILLSRFTVIVCILVVIFSKPTISDQFLVHKIIEFVGYFLVVICALGRVYVSVFIGGFKNQKLIDYGPFSIVRNPLYSLSLVGIFGLSLMSVNVIIVCVMSIFFAVLYYSVIRREEARLLAEFAESYRLYMAKTPSLLPNFSLYKVPTEIPFKPRFVTLALIDAIWWFVPFPVFEFINMLQQSGVIPAVKFV